MVGSPLPAFDRPAEVSIHPPEWRGTIESDERASSRSRSTDEHGNPLRPQNPSYIGDHETSGRTDENPPVKRFGAFHQDLEHCHSMSTG